MLSFRWFYPDGQHHFSLAEQHFILTEFQNLPFPAIGTSVGTGSVLNEFSVIYDAASKSNVFFDF